MSDSDSDSGPSPVQSTTAGLESSDVVSKYRSAADILKSVLEKLSPLVVKPGTKIIQLCKVGDALILKETSKVFTKKKDLQKGIAFPTSISVNNTVGHYSPLPDKDDNDAVLEDGDVVKVDMGVHIDGYACVAAHTFVCGGQSTKVTGRAADVIMAAHTAAEAVLRLIRPGVENTQITDIISRVAKQYDVRPMQGVLSHNMEKDKIDGSKTILNYSDAETKVEKCEIAVNDVFSIDIVMSTGEGKPRQLDERTTIFKRNPESSYKLKMKASRYAFTEMKNKHGVFPFTVRAFEDVTRARLGMVECERHNVVQGYPVLYEKDEDIVAHMKYTVLVLPNGALRISGLPIDTSRFEAGHDLQDEEIQKLLDTPITTTSSKKKKKKNKKKKAAASNADEE